MLEHTQHLLHVAEEGNHKEVARLMPLSDPEQLGYVLEMCAEKGYLECLEVLINHPHSVDHLGQSLKKAAEHNHIECVSFLINHVDPKYHNSLALRYAALGGHAQLVEMLIDVSEPADLNSAALRDAAMLGHAQCVELLIPVSKHFERALITAVEHEHVSCVRLLAPHIDITKTDILTRAVQNKDIECVRILLPYSDPKFCNSDALQWASHHNNQDIFDLLYPVSDPQAALDEMLSQGPPSEYTNMLEARIKVQLEKEFIEQQLDASNKLNQRKHKI